MMGTTAIVLAILAIVVFVIAGCFYAKATTEWAYVVLAGRLGITGGVLTLLAVAFGTYWFFWGR
jgi:hypothetical protein